MTRSKLPQARGIWKIRRTVVQAASGAKQQRTKHQPRSHHPTHVGEPADAVARMHIRAERHVLCNLYRETTMRVHGTLWTAGGAAGIDDQQRIFRSSGFKQSVVGLCGKQRTPQMIAARLHRNHIAGMLHNNHMLHSGQIGKRLIRHGLQRHNLATPPRTVCSKERACAGIFQPRADCTRAKPREQRHDHRSNFCNRQQRNHNLGRHRQMNCNCIPLAQPQPAQRICAAVYIRRQRPVCQRRLPAILALPFHGHAVSTNGVCQPFVNAVVHNIQLPANTPLRKLNSTRNIQHLPIGTLKTDVQIFNDCICKPRHVCGGTGLQLI